MCRIACLVPLIVVLCATGVSSTRPSAAVVKEITQRLVHASATQLDELSSRETEFIERSEKIENSLYCLNNSVRCKCSSWTRICDLIDPRRAHDPHFSSMVERSVEYSRGIAFGDFKRRTELHLPREVWARWHSSHKWHSVDSRIAIEFANIMKDIEKLQNDVEDHVEKKQILRNELALEMAEELSNNAGDESGALINGDAKENISNPVEAMLPLAYMSVTKSILGRSVIRDLPSERFEGDTLAYAGLQGRPFYQTHFDSDDEMIEMFTRVVRDLQSGARIRRVQLIPCRKIFNDAKSVLNSMQVADPLTDVPDSYSADGLGRLALIAGQMWFDKGVNKLINSKLFKSEDSIVTPMLIALKANRDRINSQRAIYRFVKSSTEELNLEILGPVEYNDRVLKNREQSVLAVWRQIVSDHQNGIASEKSESSVTTYPSSPQVIETISGLLTILENELESGFVHTDFDSIYDKIKQCKEL